MKPYRVRVEVSLKPGHSDPEGDATAEALRDLGYPVEGAKVSKVYTLMVKAYSREDAERLAEEVSRRLLANPTKDTYMVRVEEMG
ncbi:MAG: phosphoribosylformylglycinamidine synthase subunit PurS [Candidatus Bathyarchaeia archaeon]|nr:phosphoribosylformylglycinamidine synthase subunit PurS [Candidatus Bathyarchaeota archaeon]